MTISEKYSKEKLVYELSKKKVTSFSKYYGGLLDKTSQVKLSTLSGQTKITDYRGNISYVIYENNLPCVGVIYGYGSLEELMENQADYLVDTVAKLTDLLL